MLLNRVQKNGVRTDAPGGGGKIPLIPKYFQGEDDDYVYLKNFEGKDYKYPKHS
ncbi:hypothetical protein J6W78_04400 [bacterium]|nr:hypothetical protein [bacterium]